MRHTIWWLHRWFVQRIVLDDEVDSGGDTANVYVTNSKWLRQARIDRYTRFTFSPHKAEKKRNITMMF